MDKATEKFYEQFDNWELEMYFGKINKDNMTKEQKKELEEAREVVRKKNKGE